MKEDVKFKPKSKIRLVIEQNETTHSRLPQYNVKFQA